MSQQDDEVIAKAMREKAGWARRCLARMEEAKAKDPVATQDHFWSYLHAAHLIWFYFARWVKATGRADAKGLFRRWKATLAQPDVEIWDILVELRNKDVHVEPVPAEQLRTGGKLARRGGKLVRLPSGKVLRLVTYRYVVRHAGKEILALDLCRKGLPLLDRFINEFATL